MPAHVRAPSRGVYLAEQAWRPRPCQTQTGDPGRLGFPSALTMKGCLQWLDEVRRKGVESRLDRRGVRAPVSGPGRRSRGGRRHKWSAGGRRARKARGTFYEVQTKT